MKKILLAILTISATLFAEPYMAFRDGMKCSQCHFNRSGGGKRTDFGVIYASTVLPLHYLQSPDSSGLFSNKLSDAVSVGANFRIDETRSLKYSKTVINGSDTIQALVPADRSAGIKEGNFYVQVDFVPNRLTFYLDEQVTPTATNRESFGMLHGLPGNSFIKVGRMLLPYGIRMMDDLAFIRSLTGYTYGTHDMAVEVGAEPGPFSFILNVTETSARSVNYIVFPKWRFGVHAAWSTKAPLILPAPKTETKAGISGSVNYSIFTLFGELDGIRTPNGAPSAFIPDPVVDSVYVNGVKTARTKLDYSNAIKLGANKDALIGLVSLNTLAMKGVNIPITYEFYNPNIKSPFAKVGKDRLTIGVESFVYQFFQVGLFYRMNRSVETYTTPNQDEVIARFHVAF